MAEFVTTIETPQAPDEAFGYLADLRNLAEWDPGVRSVTQVVGDGAGSDAEFDVVVEGVRPMTLRYRTTTYEPPCTLTVEASNRVLTSLDTITIEASGDGSTVTYDAELRLAGPLGLFDPLLRPVFSRIGGRANEGLLRALDGVQR